MDSETRANQAKQIQENPVFQDIIEGMKMEAYEKLSVITPTDSEAIQKEQALIRAADGFRDHMMRIIQKGPQPARHMTKQQ